MQRLGFSLIAAGLLTTAAGCRLPGRDGPVSESLAASRHLSQQGVAALERGQIDSAETLLAKAVKTCPADPEARRHYAEVLMRRGARSEAMAQLTEAIRISPDDALLRVRMAEIQLAAGKLADARQSAETAVDLDPRSAAAWACRGRVARALDQPRQALADFQRALTYAPDDRAVLLDVAEMYRQLNEPYRALQTLQVLADTYTPSEEPQQVLHLTGLAYLALGRPGDAADALSEAVVRESPTAELFYCLAEAQRAAGRPSEAAAAAQQALKLDPQHGPSRALLGRLQLARRPQAPAQ